VALGREVDDRIDPMIGENSGDQRLIADVTVDEVVPRIAREVRKVGGIAGVGEQVKIDQSLERRARLGEALTDEVAADEAATAGNEEIHA
jgi:hypothetical protein